jgi:hypothetical protein
LRFCVEDGGGFFKVNRSFIQYLFLCFQIMGFTGNGFLMRSCCCCCFGGGGESSDDSEDSDEEFCFLIFLFLDAIF